MTVTPTGFVRHNESPRFLDAYHRAYMTETGGRDFILSFAEERERAYWIKRALDWMWNCHFHIYAFYNKGATRYQYREFMVRYFAEEIVQYGRCTGRSIRLIECAPSESPSAMQKTTLHGSFAANGFLNAREQRLSQTKKKKPRIFSARDESRRLHISLLKAVPSFSYDRGREGESVYPSVAVTAPKSIPVLAVNDADQQYVDDANMCTRFLAQPYCIPATY